MATIPLVKNSSPLNDHHNRGQSH